MREIRCGEDLGIADCDFVARGEAPGEIMHEMVEHLREEHDMDLPDAEAILQGDVDETDVDDKIWMVVRRLREDLETDYEDSDMEAGAAAVPPEPF
jgi:predicted small metal-binding protein